MKQYNYVIIKENYSELERETTLGENKYQAKKKYAFIVKQVHKDGSESISYIQYENDLEKLHKQAEQYVSWYNYPIGVGKGLNGDLMKI